MTISFENTIKDLIGDSYTSMNGEADALNAAIRWVADALPTELLLKYAVSPAEFTDGSAYNTKNKKILRVMRRDEAGGSGGKYRTCRALEKGDFDKASDTNSMYTATKYSPVYTLWNEGGTPNIVFFPVPTSDQKALLWYFDYPSSTQLTQTSYNGLPVTAELAVCYKAAMLLISNYIKTAVQDDEDSEILQMLTAQSQNLQGLLQGELATMTDTEQKRGTE